MELSARPARFFSRSFDWLLCLLRRVPKNTFLRKFWPFWAFRICYSQSRIPHVIGVRISLNRSKQYQMHPSMVCFRLTEMPAVSLKVSRSKTRPEWLERKGW